MHFVKDKKFYISLLCVALPIAAQNLITFGINMMDTIMLGQLGDEIISAANLAGQPFFIFTLLTYGIAGGASVLASQYWGKRDVAAVRKVISIALQITMVFSVIFALLVLLLPEVIMRIYTNDEQIIAYGVQYLQIVGYIYLFFGLSNTFVTSIRSMEIVMISVVSNIITFVVNVVFNAIFIFGLLGAPALGIRGAAIGTLIARVTEFCILAFYALKLDKKLCLRVKDLFRFDRELFQDFVRYSIPVVLNELMWSIGTSLQSGIFGHIGKAAVSANTITGVIQQLATITVFGVANAAAVMVGKSIGANDIKRAKETTFTLTFISIGIGLLSAGIIFLIRGPVINFYNVSEETKRIAYDMMAYMAVIVFFISLSALFIVGVLRGAGDARFTLLAEIASLWLVSVPVGALVGLVFKLPVPLVYLFFKLDEPMKVICCLFRFKGGKWIKNVTRDFGEEISPV